MKQFLIILLLIGNHYCKAQKKATPAAPFNATITTEKLEFDLKVLKEVLEKSHPGLYWYQTKGEFEDACQSIQSSIGDGKTEHEFFKLVNPLVAGINCGHTSAWLSNCFYEHVEAKGNFGYLPIDILLVNDKMYLRKNYSENAQLKPGAQILSINGKPSREIIHQMLRHESSDGYNTTAQHLFIEGNFYEFYTLLFGDTKDFKATHNYEITFVDEWGDTHVSKLKGLDYTQSVALRSFSESTPNQASYFNYKIIDSLSTAILSVKTFESGKCKSFFRKSFRAIKKNKVQNLIIDLRGNDGGADRFGSLLYSYLASDDFFYYKKLELVIDSPKDSIFKYTQFPSVLKMIYALNLVEPDTTGRNLVKNIAHKNLRKKAFCPHKNAFHGKAYILIDGGSFSVTSEFAAIAHHNNRAIFIGQETGGGYCGNTSGAFIFLKLPYSGISVRIPTVRYYSYVSTCHYGKGILPHHPVAPTIEQALSGRDVEMDYALDLIKGEEIED